MHTCNARVFFPKIASPAMDSNRQEKEMLLGTKGCEYKHLKFSYLTIYNINKILTGLGAVFLIGN